MSPPAPATPARPAPPAWALALLCLGATGYLLAAAARHAGESTDYTQDYLAATALFAGQSIYAPMDEAAAGVAADPRVRVNDHPPPYVVALAPLALLPPRAAFLVLAGASCAATVAAGLVVGLGRGWGWTGGWAVALVLLLHPGTGTGLVYGTVSAGLLALVVAAWWAAGHDRGAAAGACVGLAAGVKLFPGLLALAFLPRRDLRAAAAAGGVALGCWVGAAAAVGVADVRTYVTERAPANARAFVPSAFNQSVAGAAHRTFGEPDPNTPWLGRAAVRPDLAAATAWGGRAAVVGLVVLGLLRGGRPPSPDRAFALLVPAMLLLSPLTWLHAIPMTVLPVSYLLAAAPGRGRRRLLGVAGLLLVVNDVWLGAVLGRHFGPGVPWWGNLAMLAPMWGTGLVLVLVATTRDPG